MHDKRFTNIGRMPFVHPFFMEPAAQRVMWSPYISEMLLFDRLHNVRPSSVHCTAVQQRLTRRVFVCAGVTCGVCASATECETMCVML